MSVVDVFQCVGVIITSILSIIGLILAYSANKKADESNKLSQDANNLAETSNKIAKIANENAEKSLRDSQKDYMPMVKFVDKLDIATKTIETLRNEITFDFDKTVLTWNNYGYEELDELVCIEAKIRNCGKGVIKAIEISDFFIQNGNKINMKAKENLHCLCYIEEKCKEYFVLEEGETVTVNFMISEKLCKEKNYKESDVDQDRIKEFFEDYNNMIIGMNLKIESVNDTSYVQDFLMGTALDKKIVHNSFEKCDICIGS